MDKLQAERYFSVNLMPVELKTLYAAVQWDFARHQISQRQYMRMLRSLAAVDARGNLWALDVQSGSWQRRIAGKWVKSEPRGSLRLIRKVITVWICPFCKTGNALNKRFCTHCGAEKPGGQGTQPGKTPACLKCGSALKDGAAFCTRCGQKVATEMNGGLDD
jgi:hypothetical protein